MGNICFAGPGCEESDGMQEVFCWDEGSCSKAELSACPLLVQEATAGREGLVALARVLGRSQGFGTSGEPGPH